ncbi:Hypothetical predicted protein [Paramuricea clavata]|uniref:Uncharacterized protein n=1 Tax=Paramuricea clavata TaxID=317549 RepID=A0A6S7GI96_PARCT|nr:Hypothetical predicted protein [Paramuricea clavata]
MDATGVRSYQDCLKHAWLLTGDVVARISTNRRELVLKKINPLMVSLAQEEFSETNRNLFGSGFEQRLKTRSETAETIGKVSRASNPFFSWGGLQGIPQTSWGPTRIQLQDLSPIQSQRDHVQQGEEKPRPGLISKIYKSPDLQVVPPVKNFRPDCSPKGQFDSKYTPNGTRKVFHPRMGNDHTGPLDPAGHPGLADRTCNSSSATVITQCTKAFFNTRDCVGARGKRIVDEASNSSSTIPKARGRIYKFYLCGAQEIWGKSSSSKSKIPEPVSRLRACQDGGHPHVKGSIKEGRFSRENRAQGCLPDSANLEEPPKISAISLEGHHAGVLMPSFRFGDRAKGFYQAYEPGNRGIEAKRYSRNYIFRRYPNYGRISQSSITSCSLNPESPRGARFHSKLPDVTTLVLPRDGISGVFD